MNQLEGALDPLMAEIERLKQVISDAEYAAVAAKRDEEMAKLNDLYAAHPASPRARSSPTTSPQMTDKLPQLKS